MAKYVFQKENMPHYSQITNACGITAVLMAIQPNTDAQARKLLEKVAQKCRVMYPGLNEWFDQENSKHQFAAAYMILKASVSGRVHEFLTNYDADNYEFMNDIIGYELKKRMTGKSEKFSKSLDKEVDHFLKKGEKASIDKVFLYEYTTRMKTDQELKLLMALFGYKFIRVPYSADGTGAVNFDMIDQIISSGIITDGALNNYDEIYEFLLAFIEVNFDKSAMIINTGAHWVTAQEMIIQDEKRIPQLFYLDPSSTSKPLLMNLSDKKSVWFYVFQTDEELRRGVTPIVEKLLDIKL
ncbi:MAG TPA: hypothetical protein VKM55_28590 [Candidatus Lokiarchaeia archaeon]|nr:hypothetical protein [Candidatus Lokiarchaeia archaeon]